MLATVLNRGSKRRTVAKVRLEGGVEVRRKSILSRKIRRGSQPGCLPREIPL